MFKNKKVSIILPCYNEGLNVKKAINDFFKIDVVDEVIAVDNNSSDKTDLEIKKTNAKYFFEKQQGYGFAIRRGLNESTGYYIIVVEPDGSFEAKEVLKFLDYNCDVVLGTRTNSAYIKEGAKMDWFLRIGNKFISFLVNILFKARISDVGCTFKLITKPALSKIASFKIG
jgi:glycosyltransferase involved in cell wall biosynthesis